MHEEYRDPRLFFERTHFTRTLQSLIRDVFNTLRGQPGTQAGARAGYVGAPEMPHPIPA